MSQKNNKRIKIFLVKAYKLGNLYINITILTCAVGPVGATIVGGFAHHVSEVDTWTIIQPEF